MLPPTVPAITFTCALRQPPTPERVHSLTPRHAAAQRARMSLLLLAPPSASPAVMHRPAALPPCCSPRRPLPLLLQPRAPTQLAARSSLHTATAPRLFSRAPVLPSRGLATTTSEGRPRRALLWPAPPWWPGRTPKWARCPAPVTTSPAPVRAAPTRTLRPLSPWVVLPLEHCVGFPLKRKG